MTNAKPRRSGKADRIAVANLIAQQHSDAFIVRTLGLQRAFVARWRARIKTDGHVEDAIRLGRPRKRTAVVVDRVRRKLLRKKRTSIRTARAQLSVAGTRISKSTVGLAAHDANLHPYRHVKKPRLTAEHCRRRLEFAHQHLHTDWRQVLFVDDTARRLHESPNPHNDVVWAERGTVTGADVNVPRVHAPTSIRACGGICSRGKTKLHLFEKTFTADDYVDVLDKVILPGGDKLFGGGAWTLLQDRAPAHTAASVTEFLELRHPMHMTADWPPHSPDLNVIEHIWAIIKDDIRRQNPTTRDALRHAVVRAWNRIPQQQIDHMIDSMPARLQAVIDAKGGNTRW
jgi:hypothetical protein